MELAEAREFAVRAHGDQTYGEGKPYEVHLDDVVAILQEYGYGGAHLLAGLLHDVVEDSPLTAEDLLAAGFSDEVVAIVLFATDENGHNRRTKKERTYRRVREQLDQYRVAPDGFGWLPKAIRVKLADRLGNIRRTLAGDGAHLLQMYRKERRIFREAYYLPGVADAMWVEYDRLLGG